LPLCRHAPAEVKAAADYVTLDIEHGGLAAAIKKFLL
jgi:hydroxymethylpyrimidine pyrophosphatase-like HAD family hydrolase